MSDFSTLADLKAITAEHVNKFDAQGRTAVKGANRKKHIESKDPFDKPSPGLIKRLAAEARNDAKRRVFQDDEAGPSDEQRREIMLAKAKKYEALKKGDFSGLTTKELEEGVLDFDRWQEEEDDVDESADLPRELEDSLEQVEYVDEMGRTRMGTLREKREAERLRRTDRRGNNEAEEEAQDVPRAYDEVLASNVIRGDQNFFPIYQPDPDELRAKWKAAQEEERAHHYDASKEVRTRGAGAYQFSLDDQKRAEQMASLKGQRLETEKVRNEASKRVLSAAQEAQKRKVEERRALIEAKRRKVMGGDKVDALREEKRKAEADKFLSGLEKELHEGDGDAVPKLE